MEPRASPALRWALVLLGAIALAALSLLWVHEPTYDPLAWLIWGRELAHGTLDTVAGPSWKPLPVVFTTIYSWLAGGGAAELWLITARAALIVAVVLAFRLGRSLGGTVGGVVAAVAVVLIARLLSLALRGSSEGVLIALVLGAIELHRAGRLRGAFACVFAAGLLRPEMWPFVVAYAVWWVVRDRRIHVRRAAIAAAAGAALLAVWFVPEKAGSGRLFRSAARALEPVSGTPGQSSNPFLATFTHAAGAVIPALYAAAAVTVVLAFLAWRRGSAGTRERTILLLAAGATAYMLIVAVLAEAGFTGDERYAVLPAAIVCVLGGAGVARLVEGRGGGITALGAVVVAVVALTAVPQVLKIVHEARGVVSIDRRYADLENIVRSAGGARALPGCGQLYTSTYETQLVAWTLHRRPREVGIHPVPPGTILALGDQPQAGDARFPVRTTSRYWVLRSTCAGR